MADTTQEETKAEETCYTIYYWPGFMGRAGPLIYMLEDCGAKYEIKPATEYPLKTDSFAVPAVSVGDVTCGQTPACMQLVGGMVGKDCESLGDKTRCLQISLDAADVQSEAFSKKGAFYESEPEKDSRAATWLKYWDAQLGKCEGPYFFGESTKYCDYYVLTALKFMVGNPACAELITGNVKTFFDAMCNIEAIKNYTALPLMPVKKTVYTVYYHDGFLGRAAPLVYMLRDCGAEFELKSAADYPLKTDAFAVPAVQVNGISAGQTPACMQLVGGMLGKDGDNPMDKARNLQIGLDAADIQTEAFSKKAAFFQSEEDKPSRASVWLNYLDKQLAKCEGPYFFGVETKSCDYYVYVAIAFLMLNQSEECTKIMPAGVKTFYDAISGLDAVTKYTDRPLMPGAK